MPDPEWRDRSKAFRFGCLAAIGCCIMVWALAIYGGVVLFKAIFG